MSRGKHSTWADHVIIHIMDIQIPLTIKLSEDKQSKDAPWVAYTPELDIVSCGPTEEKAKKNLNEAIAIVLRGAAEDGNLRDILLEAGFEIKTKSLTPPKVSLNKFIFNLEPSLTRQIWPA